MRRPPAVAAVAAAWLLGATAACTRDPQAQVTASTASDAASDDDEATLAALLADRTFPLLLWAAYTVEQEYYERRRFDGREQLHWALHTLGLQFPELFAELAGDTVRVTVGEAQTELAVGPLGSPLAAAEVVEKVLIFAKEHLGRSDGDGDREATLRRLEVTAINGLLAPLDPHTILLTPEERSDLGIRTKGHFGGIGAEIVADARRIRVVRVLPESPAAAAGLMKDDLILQIDGESTVNMAAIAAQNLLRGPFGAEVALKIRRGAELVTVTIVRQTIQVASVTSERLPDDVAYLRLTTFQENTGDQVRAALATLAAEAPLRGVILDLRGNTGGLLTQAIAVLDLFVREGELVIVRSAGGREAEPATPEVAVGDEVAVVALIDEEAASASEIVSGSLRALGRGVVLGRRSFGKGTVQMLRPISPYGREFALKLTVAEYQVAGDRRIQTVGVAPDLTLYPVTLSEIPGIASYFDTERFDRRRERSQVAHLPSARHDAALREVPTEAAILRYLGGRREVARGEAAALAEPEVAFAREVAVAIAGAKTAEARQTALAALHAELVIREDQAVVAGLGAQGVAWAGDPEPTAAPPLEITATLLGEPPIAAGAPFVVDVTVHNRGEVPARRLHLLTDFVDDELDGIELLLGEVAGGASVRRQLNLKVMPWHPSFADDLRIAVHRGEPGPEAAAADTSVRLEVAGLPRPQPRYDYWVVDDPALVAAAPPRPAEEGPAVGEPFKVVGNGDGVLQPGERVLLAVAADNPGPATAETVRALLRNRSGAQGLLEEGFLELGELAVGRRVAGAFGLTVAAEADLRQPLELDLMVADVQLREAARDRFGLRIVGERPAFVAEVRRLAVKPGGARLYNGADSSAAILSELPGGAVVEVVGAVGGWLAVALEPGRRAWLPADLMEEAPAGATPTALPERPARLVEPPMVAVEAPPRVVTDPTVTLAITASHPRRLRDVTVAVAPVGPGARETKVFFAANPARVGEAARSLAATAEVALAPGGNQITVTARDGEDVMGSRELRVFRAPDDSKATREPGLRSPSGP